MDNFLVCVKARQSEFASLTSLMFSGGLTPPNPPSLRYAMPVKAKPLRGALRAACDRRSASAQCVAMAERGKPVRRFARTGYQNGR